MSKKEKIFILAYILILGFSYLFISRTLNDETIKMLEKPSEKKAVEIKPVKVTLVVNSCLGNREIKEWMTSADTVYSLLIKLRDQNKIYFETVWYTYGTEITKFDDCKPLDSKWVIKNQEGTVINPEIEKLQNDKIYTISQ